MEGKPEQIPETFGEALHSQITPLLVAGSPVTNAWRLDVCPAGMLFGTALRLMDAVCACKPHAARPSSRTEKRKDRLGRTRIWLS